MRGFVLGCRGCSLSRHVIRGKEGRGVRSFKG